MEAGQTTWDSPKLLSIFRPRSPAADQVNNPPEVPHAPRHAPSRILNVQQTEPN